MDVVRELRFRVKVHKKGIVVIPAEVRRILGIEEGSYLDLYVEDNSIRIVVPKDLREAFGIDGERALEVAKLINQSRRAEIEELRS